MRTLFALLLVPMLVSSTEANAFKRTAVGDPLKDFSLEALVGEPLVLSQALGDKATVVVFWATWSSRSAEMLRDLGRLQREHANRGLRVVGVNVEHQEWDPDTVDKVRAVGVEAEVDFPLVFDKDLGVFNTYGVIAVPSAVLYDGSGTVVEMLQGYSSEGRYEFRERIYAQIGVETHDQKAAAKRTEMGYQPKGKAGRYYRMGTRFLEKKMAGRAVKSLRQALEEDPDYADAYRALGDALEAEGETAEAATVRAKAAALDGGAAAGNPPDAGAAVPAAGNPPAPEPAQPAAGTRQ